MRDVCNNVRNLRKKVSPAAPGASYPKLPVTMCPGCTHGRVGGPRHPRFR